MAETVTPGKSVKEPEGTGGGLAGDANPDDVQRRETRMKGEWGFTELESKNLVLLTVLVVTWLITLGTFAAIASWDDEDTVRKTAHLNVEDVKVLPADHDAESQTYTLELIVIVTNTEPEPADNVHIEIAGIDYNSKLTYSIASADVDGIPGERTEVIHANVTVPVVKTYKMLIMVYQDESIKVKGYIYITIEGSGPRKDFTVYYSKESTKDVVESGDDEISELTVFIGYLFYVILVMETYIVLRLMDFREMRSALSKIRTGLRERG